MCFAHSIQALLSHGAKVYFACRDEAKAKAAIDDLEKATGKRGIFLQLDLSSLDSVRKAAKTFQRWFIVTPYAYSDHPVVKRIISTFFSITRKTLSAGCVPDCLLANLVA